MEGLKDICYTSRKCKQFSVSKVVYKTRVPIITLKHTVTGCDIDITMQNTNDHRRPVIQNTSLLRNYSTQNPDIGKAFRYETTEVAVILKLLYL